MNNKVVNIIIVAGEHSGSRGIADFDDTYVENGTMFVCVYLFDETRATYRPTNEVMIEE